MGDITLSVTCDRWVVFSPGTPVSSTNETDRNGITEILLKVALSTINLTTISLFTCCVLLTFIHLHEHYQSLLCHLCFN